MINLNRRIKFADYVYRLDFDVLLLAETWLTTDIKSAELFLPDYDIIRGDRPIESDASRHGGVLIAVKKTIKSEGFSVAELPLSVQSLLRVTKLIGLEPFFIAVLYSPPAGSKYRISTEDLQKLFRFLEETCSKRLLLSGDFNMPHTNWSTYDASNEYENQIASLLFDMNLKQYIDFNTTKKSCLDLVLCNEDPIINDTTLGGNLSRFSDHFPITINVSIKSKVSENSSTRYFSYCNCNFDSLNEAIIANPFKPYCYSNVDVNTNLWYEWILKLIEIHVPVRTKNRQLLPPWKSAETSHHMNKIKTERRKLQKKGLCTSEKLTDECDQLQIKDRVEHEQKLFASRHKGRIYKYLKSLKKDSLTPVIKSVNLKREASTDLEKANLLNNYFATVVTDDGYEYFEPSKQHNFGENDISITEDLSYLTSRRAEVKIRYHQYCLKDAGDQ